MSHQDPHHSGYSSLVLPLLENIGIDLTQRPDTYWPESLNQEQLLARIKGKTRRSLARKILKEKGFTALNEFVAREKLTNSERKFWGRLHPNLIGGEYLPELPMDAVEIARILLRSSTRDVITIRARRDTHRIVYSVIDEYEGDFEYRLAFTESQEPLTLAELIAFIDGTMPLGIAPELRGGLVQVYWNYCYRSCGDAVEATDFATAESAYYPELRQYYWAVADKWIALQKNDVLTLTAPPDIQLKT